MVSSKPQRWWLLFLIIIIVVVAVLYFMTNIQLSPSSTQLNQPSEVCPSPSSSFTVCINDIACSCVSEKDAGGHEDINWVLPPGSTCKDRQGCVPGSVIQIKIRDIDAACDFAGGVEEPSHEQCNPCAFKGIYRSVGRSATCCTVTKTLMCEPKPDAGIGVD